MPSGDGNILPTSKDAGSQNINRDSNKDFALNLVENEDDYLLRDTDKNAVFRTLLLDLIHKLSNEISETKQLASTTQEIVNLITETFPITFSSIELYDSASHVSFSSISISENVILTREPLPVADLNKTLAGEVIRRNSTLIFSDKNKGEYLICPSLSQALKIKHFIGIPIVVETKTIGVFTIASARNITVDRETITWSETIGHQISALFARDFVQRRIEKLEYNVLHDPTSGLANRVLFHDELNKILLKSSKKPVTIFSIDLGRYGFIVESLGYDAADEIMCDLANRIELITSSNDLIARVGSSEFALLITTIDNHDDARTFAQELIQLFLEPFDIEDQEIILNPSIGIAITDPRKKVDAESVFHDAHSAMAKSRESNGVQIEFASQKRSVFAIKRLNKERELSKAILRSQLSPFYQAEIDLNTNKIVGAEALARWFHPRHGMLAPRHFIDIAEETNLIGPLFELIFKKVLHDTLELYDRGHELTVWTNISAKQFQTHNISQIIGELVAESNTPPHMIGIEITETALMKDPLFAAEEFKRMKNLGIKIALDDFGTGYSSLSHLALFPVDVLKIDRSFVIDIASETSSSEIVSAVIGLAKGLKISTLAEGIETQSQLEALTSLGCDMGQGYLISRPSSFEKFVEFASSNSDIY